MKDIHVFLINYNIPSDLRKALTSLNYILPRLNKVAIFDAYGLYLHKSNIPLRVNIEYVDAQGDLGAILNSYVQTVESEYIMFLFKYDLLLSEVKNIPLTLEGNEPVMTLHFEGNQLCKWLPLMVRTSFLKNSPFLLEREVPFKEMIFHSWFMKNFDSGVVKLKQNILGRIREINDITDREKLNFISKFNREPYQTISTMPTLSVMISNFNMEKFIQAAIRSCIAQSLPFDQIIVVDDGSTDGSLKLINQLMAPPNIQCLSKSNEGKAKALNYILPFLTSEFVLELDADDWLDPDAVLLIKKHLTNLPQNIPLLYGNLRYWMQESSGDIGFSKVRKGKRIRNRKELLSYKFPLGPRIYRTSALIKEKGFPVINFKEGRLYEDVTILVHLFKKYEFCYEDFTVYNVRKHDESITKKNHPDWNDFRKFLT